MLHGTLIACAQVLHFSTGSCTALLVPSLLQCMPGVPVQIVLVAYSLCLTTTTSCEQAEYNVNVLLPAQPQARGLQHLSLQRRILQALLALLMFAVSMSGAAKVEMVVMQVRSRPLQLWHTTEPADAMQPHPTRA